MLTVVQVLGVSNEDEMVACFLSGELSSQRFGQNLRSHLAVAGQAEQFLTHPDLSDAGANVARRALLAATHDFHPAVHVPGAQPVSAGGEREEWRSQIAPAVAVHLMRLGPRAWS